MDIRCRGGTIPFSIAGASCGLGHYISRKILGEAKIEEG